MGLLHGCRGRDVEAGLGAVGGAEDERIGAEGRDGEAARVAENLDAVAPLGGIELPAPMAVRRNPNLRSEGGALRANEASLG